MQAGLKSWEFQYVGGLTRTFQIQRFCSSLVQLFTLYNTGHRARSLHPLYRISLMWWYWTPNNRYYFCHWRDLVIDFKQTLKHEHGALHLPAWHDRINLIPSVVQVPYANNSTSKAHSPTRVLHNGWDTIARILYNIRWADWTDSSLSVVAWTSLRWLGCSRGVQPVCTMQVSEYRWVTNKLLPSALGRLQGHSKESGVYGLGCLWARENFHVQSLWKYLLRLKPLISNLPVQPSISN